MLETLRPSLKNSRNRLREELKWNNRKDVIKTRESRRRGHEEERTNVRNRKQVQIW